MKGFVRFITVPVVLAIITVLTGTTGYFYHLSELTAYEELSELQLLTESFFRSLEFLVLSMNINSVTNPASLGFLTTARVAGFLFFFYAAVAGLGLVFTKQLKSLRVESWSLLSHLPGFDEKGHVIVCGVSDDGYSLAIEALENGQNVVAIHPQSTDLTEALDSKGAIVFIGDASRQNMLENSARITRAKSVFVTFEKDRINGNIIESINTISINQDWPIIKEITARIDNRRVRQTMHDELSDTSGIHLRTYGVSDVTARELLKRAQIDTIDTANQRVHIWVVGWTSLSESLVYQLLHLMHYPDHIRRQITIITETPSKVEQDLADMSPGIVPEWWDDAETSEFVQTLFPDIDIQTLPTSDMELLCDRTLLYDTITQGDKLTIFADSIDNQSLKSLLSTWSPKLDDIARQLDLDAQLAYRRSDGSNWKPSMSVVTCLSYMDFDQGCSIEAVLGKQRDKIAKQMALIYHLRYENDPENKLPNRSSIPTDVGDDIDTVMKWLSSLSEEDRERYANSVWYDLPEYKRESNRYAADHVPVKYRMASVLGNENGAVDDTTIRLLAETEHRRWCAEKILAGWEPLPNSKRDRWETKTGEQILRNQRYHSDIRSVESLREETNGEWNKDVSQVKAILNYPEIVSYNN